MRLETIEQLRRSRDGGSQVLYPEPTTQISFKPHTEFQVTLANRIKHQLSRVLFPLAAARAKKRHPDAYIPEATHVLCGTRFCDYFSSAKLRTLMKPSSSQSVLLVGCHFNSPEVRHWLSEPVGSVTMLDIVDWSAPLAQVHSQLKRLYRPSLHFAHGTLDHLPCDDASYDLVCSKAVLEHVGNFQGAVDEMHRVLKPGGLMAHTFGPLYFCHGGDHTISNYGPEHGYDHLLLPDECYQARLQDDHFYAGLGREANDSRYWALQGIFSYLKPEQYLAILSPRFEIIHCIVTISPAAISFREREPARWQRLLTAGLQPRDLLIDGISVILRKRQQPFPNERGQ